MIALIYELTLCPVYESIDCRPILDSMKLAKELSFWICCADAKVNLTRHVSDDGHNSSGPRLDTHGITKCCCIVAGRLAYKISGHTNMVSDRKGTGCRMPEISQNRGP